jgi:hypothetical protein
VDLGIANPAIETAGTPVLMFLSGRGVVHPATRAGELLGSPDTVGHLANPLPAVHFQPMQAATPESIPKGPFKDSNPNAANWLTGAFFGPAFEAPYNKIKSPGRSRGFSIRRKA